MTPSWNSHLITPHKVSCSPSEEAGEAWACKYIQPHGCNAGPI